MDLLVAASLSVLGAGYLAALGRVWRDGRGRVVPVVAAARFAAGWLVSAIALVSPLHLVVEERLAAHMVQHVLLTAVAAPLLASGAPLPAMLQLLPRAAVGPALAGWWSLVRALRARAAAVVAVGVGGHAAVQAGWHLPLLYNTADRVEAVHAAEHLTMTGAAVVAWWTVLVLPRRRHGGFVLLALLGQSFVSIAIGAALVLSARPVSAGYLDQPDPLADQQLAGVVMWAFGGIAGVVGAVTVLTRWLAGLERNDQRRSGRAVTLPRPTPPGPADAPRRRDRGTACT